VSVKVSVGVRRRVRVWVRVTKLTTPGVEGNAGPCELSAATACRFTMLLLLLYYYYSTTITTTTATTATAATATAILLLLLSTTAILLYCYCYYLLLRLTHAAHK
jgi:hypothetical protein